jgi:hypothetical protein
VYPSSSVGLETRLEAARPRSRGSIPGSARSLPFLQNVHTGCRAHLVFYIMDRYRGKAKGASSRLLAPSSAEVKNGGATSPLPHASSTGLKGVTCQKTSTLHSYRCKDQRTLEWISEGPGLVKTRSAWRVFFWQRWWTAEFRKRWFE